jgi:hypothetical protein
VKRAKGWRDRSRDGERHSEAWAVPDWRFTKVAAVESATAPNIAFLGRRLAPRSLSRWRTPRSVQPSVAPETFGMAIAEAYWPMPRRLALTGVGAAAVARRAVIR